MLKQWHIKNFKSFAKPIDLSLAGINVLGPEIVRLGEVPFDVSVNIRCLSSFKDLISDDEAWRIWRNAVSADDLHLAITLSALSLKRRGHPQANISDLLHFSVGENFLESLSRNQCFGAEKFGANTLEKCSHLVANTALLEIDTLGRPNPITRKADAAVAHRVHISTVKEGMRLMYWQVGAMIELANVGVKKELEIEHGRACAAFTDDLRAVL